MFTRISVLSKSTYLENDIQFAVKVFQIILLFVRGGIRGGFPNIIHVFIFHSNGRGQTVVGILNEGVQRQEIPVCT